LTPKGFSNGQYVDRYLLRDKLYAEDAITMGGVAILNNFPAADVVEVVRCRECRHYNAGFECLIEGYGIERPADYFCADGKRKNGGQDNA
jgi:hypothetical protein